MLTPEQKKANRRLGLILATVALAFFLGFVLRLVWFGR
ncbi:MAG: cytochrome oxidase small assembly protein [Hylemonella sp.]